MATTTYFVQECPTCSRNLEVRLAYLGKQVKCRHCGSRFPAHDPSSQGQPDSQSGVALIARADELLLQAASQKRKNMIGSAG